MSRILSRTLEMPRDPNKGFCRTPAIRRAGHQDVAFLRMCRTRTLSSPSVPPLSLSHRRASSFFSLAWHPFARSSPSSPSPSSLSRSLSPLSLSLPLFLSSSPSASSRIAAPEGPQNPTGCVCYPASCLRTRVVKKILATGGCGRGKGIMRG